MTRAAATVALCALSGCAAGPDFRMPEAPPVDRYTASPLPSSTTSAGAAGGDAQRFLRGHDVPQRWWTTFGNAELDRRVELALTHSPTIASAHPALRQAEETAAAAGSARFPALDASAGAAREKGASAPAGTSGSTGPLTVYNVGVDVGYVFDIFGGVRRNVEALRAQADVERAQLDATYMALAANVVAASLQEASLREQVDATGRIVASLQEELAIAQTQQAIGARSLADTLAVRSQLSRTQASLAPLEQQLAAIRNQLATYLGAAPAQLELHPVSLDHVTLPADIPVSLPSTLVALRPDIRAASAALHAATAQVGVATADMLPQISLAAGAGSAALRAGELFSTGTGTWSVGANLLQPLFHGGELRHRRRAAQAAMEQARADWQQVVLTAFRNVADALQALEYDARALSAQDTAARDAEELLSLTRTQYRVGATDYLALLSAEQQVQQARIALIQARTSRLADTAALYTALGGGGWYGALHTEAE
ncbi:MAG: efflux transporter outer membrane subunit [Steroidobacteraceae bacterium]